MKKHASKIVALVLSLCMMVCMSATAFAAEITTDGGNGSTPVSLSSTKDGTIGGDPTPTAMRVTLPTSLPMAMSQDGVVTTATDAKIENLSYGAVRVKSVTISAAENWTLTAYGSPNTLASAKVDSNQLGFAIRIGGGTQAVTTANNTDTQALISTSISGCYMTGVGDLTGNCVAVEYAAIVTPLSNAVTNATVANVVFVVEWDIAA